MIGRSRVLTGLVLGTAALVSAVVVVVVAWDRGGEEEAPQAGGLPTVPAPSPQDQPAGGQPGSPVLQDPGLDSPPIDVRGVLTPRIVLFGDTLTARVDVIVDRTRIDPESVRIATTFSPWAVVGPPERVRRDAGSTTYVRTTYVLRCLTSPCVPAGQVAPLEFSAARVSFAGAGAGEGAARDSLPVEWPVLTVFSRFASAGFEGAQSTATPWRADLLTTPAVSYRVTPGLALGLLLATGGLLALGGLVLAYVAWPRREPAPPPEPEAPPAPQLTPLELALELLEDSARPDGAEDRRRALELVAEALEERGEADDLVRWAKVLAWSEEAPAVDETSGVAARVRSLVEDDEDDEDEAKEGDDVVA
ncbi:MAG: hypothetical protein ACRDNY_11290 [Gaiellaceae bacterium]